MSGNVQEIENVSSNSVLLESTINSDPQQGLTSFCQTDLIEGFEFLHPKTTCNLTSCNHYFICQKWEQQRQRSSAPTGAILTISQSVSPSQSENFPSIVYSLSDLPSKDTIHEELNELIEKQQQEQEQDKDKPANYNVVGSGTAHATCGNYWTKVCLEDHPAKELNDIIDHQRDLNGKCMDNGAYIQRIKMTCHRPICPTCWTDWRRRQVAKVQKRFDTYEEYFTPIQKRKLKRCHIGVALPKSMHHLTKKQMTRIVLKHLKELGIEGGTIIYHSKRQYKRIRGNWTPANTYFWPHFHVYTHLYKAWINGNKTNQLSKRTGIIVRNFGERPLGKSISYQLSHAGVPSNGEHIVVWFGSMNYRKLHVPKYEGTNATCPWGHKLDHYGIWTGKDNEKPNLPNNEGYSAIVPKTGWTILPKRRRKELEDPGQNQDDFYPTKKETWADHLIKLIEKAKHQDTDPKAVT